MFCLESNIDRKYEFLLVLTENNSLLLLQQLDSSFVNEIRKKFSMIFPKNGRHEQVDVETNHIFTSISKEVTYVSCYLLYSSSLLHQIYVYYTVLRRNVLALSFQQQTFLHRQLSRGLLELILPISVRLQISVENKDSEQNRWVLVTVLNQLFQHLLNLNFNFSQPICLSLHLSHFKSGVCENIEKSSGSNKYLLHLIFKIFDSFL